MSNPLSGAVTGANDMLRRITAAQTGARAGAVKGLGLALHLVLQVSNRRVPHEEGDLERDGAVVVDDAAGIGAVTYGNSSDTAAYAVPQHEDLTFKHDPGRSAKFLELARNETREQALAIIAEQTKRGMEGAK